MTEYLWYPHNGPQLEFCQRTEFEVFFGGAKGPGKTDCLVAEMTRYIEHPRYRGLLLRKTFPRLVEIMDRCHMLYPSLGGEYRDSKNTWFFPSGAKIVLGHVQHEKDKRNYHGKEFHTVGFDELTEFEETVYLFIIANVRCSVADLFLRILSTSNPGGPGHLWVKKRFVDTCLPKKKIKYHTAEGEEREMFKPEVYRDPASGELRCFVPATVYDNPSIMKHDPAYVRRLEMLPSLEKKRFLHGVWDVFEGQVFKELSQVTHGIEPFPIPPEWTRVMVFDWGYSRPWCALYFAIDYDDVAYLYRAYYGMGKNEDGVYDPNVGLRQTNSQICVEIKKLENFNEKIGFRVADPACWGPTKLKGSNTVFGPSFYEDATLNRLFFFKADNDRLRGKQQFHQRLQVEEIIDTLTGEVTGEEVKFYAFLHDEHGERGVKRWWEEVQSLKEDPRNVEDVDTDQPDEGYDCTRYFCLHRPIIPRRVEETPPGSFKAERERLIRARNYAKRHNVSLTVAYSRVR